MASAPVQSVTDPGGTLNYIGNQDYRGFLSALAAGGNQNAQTLIGSNGGLGYVNNSGQFNTGVNGTGAPLNGNLISENNNDLAAYNKILNGDTSGGTTPTASTTGTIDPSVAALLGGQIGNVNTQIGDLGQQQQIGEQNVNDQYTKGLNSENQNFQNANDQYNTQDQRTISDLLAAKGNIATGVRQNTDALQKLLGLAGSGTSSASEIAAPFAASQAGGQQQNQVQTQYGQNLQDLATAFNQTKQQHNNNLTSLSDQKYQGLQKVGSDINSTKTNLLNTLASLTSQQADANGETVGQAEAATAPFLAQINNLLSQQAGYNQQYANPITVQNPTSYTAPTLASYNYGSTGAPTSTSSTAATPVNSPYLAPTQKQNSGAPALG